MVLNKNDLEVVELFARLSRTNEGIALKELLERELNQQDAQNRVLSDNELYRGQGQALCLAELVSLLNIANDLWNTRNKGNQATGSRF